MQPNPRVRRKTLGRTGTMTNTLAAWNYTDRVDAARRAALAAPGSFEEVVRFVSDDACEIRAGAKRGWDRGLTDCVQPVFTLELPHAGDLFFNGPWGYRAQYWVSPGHGLGANSALLAALAPKLLGAMDTKSEPLLAKIDVCASLYAASAKIWIQEIPSSFREPTRDLDVERWVLEAQNGVELARYGLAAPFVTKFEVKGALIDPYGNEVVPIRKVRRHYDIFQYGFC
jgi:hypothetical protein